MSSQRSVAPRRARPVFDGPTYRAPQYQSRLGGRVVFLLFVLLLVGAIGGGGGLFWELHHAQGSSSRPVTFTVTAGDSVNSVTNRLSHDGLINSELAFKFDARLQSLAGKLQPGNYILRHSMSIDQMVTALTVLHQVYVHVTLVEGDRYAQMAAHLAAQGIDSASFLQEVQRPQASYLNASVLSDRPAGATLEGYLFPNTYYVQPHSSGRAFAREMVQQLDRNITPAMRADIHRQGRTIFQVLTLASIVEREARISQERPLIAGVYMNRLKTPGWRLDADPTVQYSAGNAANWWPLLKTQAVNVNPASPYNTYTHNGLPPGPIANPGLSSIQAAIHPQRTPFFFFLAIPHGHGKHVFARTLAEQTANQQKYGY